MAKNRRYLDREAERRVREELQREKVPREEERRREGRDSQTRKEVVSWSIGGGSEGVSNDPEV